VGGFVDLYGRSRYRVQSEAMLMIERHTALRGEASFELWNPELDVYPGAENTRGQDYYNTQFIRDVEAIQFVLSVDPWSEFLTR
jgi:hypothetical protein